MPLAFAWRAVGESTGEVSRDLAARAPRACGRSFPCLAEHHRVGRTSSLR